MKIVTFNPDGEKISINIEMQGLYFTTYTYQLWAATTTEPPIVTNPLRQGSNENPHDDRFDVKSDYTPNEPLNKNDRRVIDVRFWVKKVKDDNGYNLTVKVYQGADNEIGEDHVSGTVGASIKEEFITIKLIAS